MSPTRSFARFALALASTNLKATFALRTAFWFQAAFMLLNNVILFTMWLIFFNRFEQVGGWRLEDMAIVFGVVAAGFGLAAILAGGVSVLAQAVVDGELDLVLVQPRSALVQAAASRSTASGWGDVATGVIFLAIVGGANPAWLLVAPVAVAASAVAFTSVGIVCQSLAFWLGRMDTLARQLTDFTLTFSLYPRPLFGGAMRLLLFTVFPAAFVGWLPVEAVREPGLLALLAAGAGAVATLVVASLVFSAGLKRYESGSRFGFRG